MNKILLLLFDISECKNINVFYISVEITLAWLLLWIPDWRLQVIFGCAKSRATVCFHTTSQTETDCTAEVCLPVLEDGSGTDRKEGEGDREQEEEEEEDNGMRNRR